MTNKPVAVVTGASSGIGAATAGMLATAGFDVVVGARRMDRLEELAARIGGTAVALDVTDPESIAAFVERVPEIAVLVNNAGGALGLETAAEAVDEKWIGMFETNVLGTMRMTRAFLPALERSGRGHIVNIGSVAALEVYPGGGGYTAAKHAVLAFTGTLRLELVGKPIRVTEVDPGLVETEFSLVRFDGDSEKAAKPYAGMTPLTAADVADAIVWAVTRPPHVNIDQIVIKPVDQATATLVHQECPVTLCYYATSHGYGHAVRAAQVMKAVPQEIDIIVRTLVPESLFREEIPRDFQYRPAEFDCGCLQRDSVTVMPRETLDHYRQISERNYRALDAEIEFLKRADVTCIACDIPSFPLLAARRAGIPGVAISNFTWHDIYREYAETDADRELLATMADEYGAATVALMTPLETPTFADIFPNVHSIPIIARKGVRDRGRIEALLGGRRTPHIAMLYIGLWGLEVDWSKVEALRDWTFLTYEAPPQPVANVVTVPRADVPPADIAASVDAVVSKPGYGTVTECIANGVPLVYVPRTEFAEYASLVKGLDRWGAGIQLPGADFAAGDWSTALAAALAASPDQGAFDTNGAQAAADVIAGFANDACVVGQSA